MAIEVRVPTTGNAGEDAVVVELTVERGSAVAQGDVVAVLETAKAAVDVEAPVDGVVLEIRCAPGDEVAEHSVLLVMGQAGESVVQETEAPSPGERSPESPLPANQGLLEDIPAFSGNSPLSASPRAKLLAERNGIDLSSLAGSGPGGRIIVPDVLAHKASQAPASNPLMKPSLGTVAVGDYRVVPVRGARKITAQRMAQSLQDSAQVTLTRYAQATALVSFHQRLRTYRELHGSSRISLSDMINFALAQTLPQHLAANSTFDWEGIRQYTTVNLGVAVDTGSALVVPVVMDASQKTLPELAEATKTLVDKARAGKIELADMEHGTFTVTNLGMFGVHWFTPVLNAPQSCILGVGAIHQQSPEIPALLPLSFTFDHRALDGAEAARALAAIADSIENIDLLSTGSGAEAKGAVA
jgi:pyruvate dehydrogenase E2 component (dihydrolipoamide acetyltransferase)